MVLIQALGTLEVQSDAGISARSVIFQPKRTALLVYLAIARPRGFHRRDTLHALLWPELSQKRARGALNKAVHDLRATLGAEVLPGRGDSEIGLAADRIACDVHAFEYTLDGGDLDGAIAAYRGELLQGFHVSNAAEFDQWLDIERRRLANLARDAAFRLVQRAEASGDTAATVAAARRALTIAPEDERSLRALMQALEQSDDRARALREFDAFAQRLSVNYGIEPSAETVALADRLRVRVWDPGAPGTAARGAIPEISYRSVAENLPDMIVLIDGSGTIHYVSPAVEPITGVSASQMLGREIWDYMHPDDLDYLKARTSSRLRGEGDPAGYTECRMRHVDGTWRRLQLRGRRHLDQRSNQPMVLVVARELTP